MRRLVRTTSCCDMYFEERLKQQFCVKEFFNTRRARRARKRECQARRVFAERSWMIPISEAGRGYICMPYYSSDNLLINQYQKLTRAERNVVAGQIMNAILDMYAAGYAHRDLHARNVYYQGGVVKIIDFEYLNKYRSKPPFFESYDLTGRGMVSPDSTDHMHYDAKHPCSIKTVLGISAAEAYYQLLETLKQEISVAGANFHTVRRKNKRKKPTLLSAYGSFRIGDLVLSSCEAQRNSTRRLERFGITESIIRGSTVLDLGCNLGGMLFELSKWQPKMCVGVEYNVAQVISARKIAALYGINAKFLQADIDVLSESFGEGPFDVVLCLSIEAHLKAPEKLYPLLSRLTKGILYFEGNGRTSVSDIEKSFRKVGFKHIQFLGTCDDDIEPRNNVRPMWIVRK